MCALLAGSALAAGAPGAAQAAARPGHTAGTHSRPALPSNFQWSSSGVLISPKPDATHHIVSIKDPSVVRYHHRWIVYATTANTAGNWSLVEMDFAHWSQAAAAPQHFLDTNPNIGTGYRAAPELFHFAPQHLWYLVYQTGLPSYSTSTNPLDPQSWSAPKNFLDSNAADHRQQHWERLLGRHVGDLRSRQLLPVLLRRQRAPVPFPDHGR